MLFTTKPQYLFLLALLGVWAIFFGFNSTIADNAISLGQAMISGLGLFVTRDGNVWELASHRMSLMSTGRDIAALLAMGSLVVIFASRLLRTAKSQLTLCAFLLPAAVLVQATYLALRACRAELV